MAFDPNKITFFARTDARGKDVPFGIKALDRQRHMYVIGKTGMGKSTMLENMAVQDIQNGEGVAFIDPHGRSAETLLNYIPEHRKDDVVYFAPFDMGYPISFNIMEDVGPEKRHLVVSGLMSVFKKIWVDAWSARMEYILQNTLMALLEYPDSTLLGVNRMLSDKDYRKKVVDNIKDPSVRSFWIDEFAKYNERYMQEAGDAIKNKIGQFTANPVIRNIIGQPKSSFDIRKMMDEKKILIMNLSKGLIGDSNANLLGSMLTTRIYLAAMSRADLSPQQMETMPNFYFYVDEFQSFANATFANILSEARKYHLNLTIANQYIEQMEEEVRDAVFGNVGTIVVFRVGPLDAEFLEVVFSPQFMATDLVNLGFAQIYLTLMIDGIGSQPFSAVTLPPIAPPQVSCKDMVIAASRRQFSRPRDEVELIIQKFHEPVVSPKPPRREEDHGNETLPKKSERIEQNMVRPQIGTSRTSETRRSEGKQTEQRAPRTSDGERREMKHRETPVVSVAQKPRQQEQRPRSHEAFLKVEKQTHTIEDLRSVLKRIVDEEKIKESVSTHTVSTSQEKMEETNRQNLRSTLSTVLRETQDVVSDSVPPNTVKDQPHAQRESQSKPSAQPAPHLAEGVSEPVITREQSEESKTEKKPPVSPKELERMMRVTVSDTPPFT